MEIGFVLRDDEVTVTPLNTAEALISSGSFTIKDLKELIAYLSVYTRYHQN